MLDGLSFALCYICSLSTYDIVITTYSLLAKEIPTAKQDEQIPGANPSVVVRRGPCWGSRVRTADNRSLFKHQRWKGPLPGVVGIRAASPVETVLSSVPSLLL